MKNRVGFYDCVKDGRYYQAMIQDSPTAILLCDPVGVFVDANEGAARFFGYSVEKLKTMRFQEVTHRDDLIASMEMVNVLAYGSVNNFEMIKRYLTKTGIAWAIVRVNAVVGDENRLEMCVVHIMPLLGCSDDVVRDFIKSKKHRWPRFAELVIAAFMGGLVAASCILAFRMLG